MWNVRYVAWNSFIRALCNVKCAMWNVHIKGFYIQSCLIAYTFDVNCILCYVYYRPLMWIVYCVMCIINLQKGFDCADVQILQDRQNQIIYEKEQCLNYESQFCKNLWKIYYFQLWLTLFYCWKTFRILLN